ncbi:MAG: hypothetical protein OHK0022_01730 [Roseiflexaceae bacterium]
MAGRNSSDGPAPPGERGVIRYARAPATVAEVMIAPVTIARPGMLLQEALPLLRKGPPLLIVDRMPFDSRCGLVTLYEANSRYARANGSAASLALRDVMVIPPFFAAPAMRLEDCATLMISSDTRRVVVMQNGRPVGIVCDSDIFQAIEARG